jgi:hypothetical protein
MTISRSTTNTRGLTEQPRWDRGRSAQGGRVQNPRVRSSSSADARTDAGPYRITGGRPSGSTPAALLLMVGERAKWKSELGGRISDEGEPPTPGCVPDGPLTSVRVSLAYDSDASIASRCSVNQA